MWGFLFCSTFKEIFESTNLIPFKNLIKFLHRTHNSPYLYPKEIVHLFPNLLITNVTLEMALLISYQLCKFSYFYIRFFPDNL